MSGKNTIRVSQILRKQDVKSLVLAKQAVISDSQEFSDHNTNTELW